MTISAATLEGSHTNVNDADVATLRSSLRGEVVVAGDARYDEARRVWNGNVDRRPAHLDPQVLRSADRDPEAAAGERLGVAAQDRALEEHGILKHDRDP